MSSLTKAQRRRLKLQMEREKQVDEDQFLDNMIQEAKAMNNNITQPVNPVFNETLTKPDPSLLAAVDSMHEKALTTSTTSTTSNQSSVLTTSTAESVGVVENLSTQPNQSTQPTQPTDKPTHIVTPPTVLVTEKDIIDKANFMWSEVKTVAKNEEKFKNMKDKEKIEFFRTNMGYASFMDDHPIVTRYMICMGQYKTVAFKKYLEKIKRVKHPDVDKREKGYMEDQWIRRQADYVQYLWEAYQKRHFNNAERQWVWQNTYKNLRGEFDDFRNMHKDIETKVEEEKSVLAAKNARDLLERLKTGTQKLSPDEEKLLLHELQVLLLKRRFQSVLDQLLKTVEPVEPTVVGTGTGPDDNQPKITMIETVDAERMGEIPDQYKDPKYRGLEAVIGADGHAVNVDREMLISDNNGLKPILEERDDNLDV